MNMHLQAGSSNEIGAPGNTTLNSFFPGVISLTGGELLAIYTAGSEFESADHRPYYSHSSDAGQHWTPGKPLFPTIPLPSGGRFSCGCKPTLYGDQVLAVGYGFERDDQTLSLSDYATKHGKHYAALENYSPEDDDHDHDHGEED